MMQQEANTAYSYSKPVLGNIVSIGRSPSRVLITHPTYDWHAEVIARLQELVQLEPGWDGYSGRPVRFEVAHFTIRMLEAVCPTGAPPPQIVPGPSGDLQLEWHTESAEIELHVKAPNDVGAWRFANGKETEIELGVDFATVSDWVQQLMEHVSAAGSAAA